MNLTRKARLVVEGHLNDEVLAYIEYSYVVEINSVRIGFMKATMNDLNAMVVDIINTYLNTKPRERSYVKKGSELFGVEYEDRYASIVRALYSLRKSGTA